MTEVTEATNQAVEVVYETNGLVSPTEIMDLREMAGSEPRTLDVWRDNIRESLAVVGARDVPRGALVGVGFVIGNRSHASLVDLSVHRAYRRLGIANRIGDELLKFVLDRETEFIGLTWDKSQPWLHDWYKSRGFRDIDFAMWHVSSLKLSDLTGEEPRQEYLQTAKARDAAES